MLIDILIIAIAALVGGWLALSPRMARSSDWQATVTPLASIMGSGFLVSAPLLGGTVGIYATVCMAGLLVLAYGVGGAIRYNIRYFEPIEQDKGLAQRIALLSRLVLCAAYFVSVSYYLQLLASFVLHMLGIDDPAVASALTTAVLVLICGIGFWRGLDRLERVEKYAVSLNLGMIAALLVALAVHNAQLYLAGQWAVPAMSSVIDVTDLRVLLGLLIVVQGFETSRYLGSEHPAEQRISTMRLAQLISTAIYLPFLALATVLFHDGLGADVTAIIKLVGPVAAVLPLLIACTAIGSQFSAAVADTEGASGLVDDLSRQRIPARQGYLLILVLTVALTWVTDVNEIIAYASRAFALFYLLQCLIAIVVCWQRTEDARGRTARLALFALLAVACAAVFLFGIPAE